MIGRPTRRLRSYTVEPKLTQIDRLHKRIHHPNGIVLIDPVVQAFRKQSCLAAIQTGNEAPHPTLLKTARRIIPPRSFSHSQGRESRNTMLA